MIYDKIDNISKYFSSFNIEYIKQFEKGKTLISGENIFKIGLEYSSKEESSCLWESHKNYIDVHVLLEGEERINISPIDMMEITKEYDEINDYMLFQGNSSQSIVLKKGYFIAFFPGEVHKTGIVIDNITDVKKYVFKFDVNLY